MAMQRWFGVVGAMALVASMTGCIGAGVDASATDEANDPISAEEARSQSWESLVGAWRGSSGPFTGLVFTRQLQGNGRHFFGDVDTGIRCITTPCPSSARLDGIYTAGAITITLRHPDRPSREAAPFYGRYYYTLRGDTLTLSQGGRVVARLTKARSYCSEVDDCGEQNLITPRCVGSFSCQDNACVYRCGPRDCSQMQCGVGYFCQDIEGTPTCLSNCARMRCTAGTTCRNTPTGASCVPNGPSCAAIRCAAGTRCVETDGVGACVPNGPGCEVIRCTPTTHCEETNGVGACVPNGPSCAVMLCARGTTCVETNGVGECVPQTGVRCGTTTCATGYVCCNPLRNICTRPGMVCIQ